MDLALMSLCTTPCEQVLLPHCRWAEREKPGKAAWSSTSRSAQGDYGGKCAFLRHELEVGFSQWNTKWGDSDLPGYTRNHGSSWKPEDVPGLPEDRTPWEGELWQFNIGNTTHTQKKRTIFNILPSLKWMHLTLTAMGTASQWHVKPCYAYSQGKFRLKGI